MKKKAAPPASRHAFAPAMGWRALLIKLLLVGLVWCAAGMMYLDAWVQQRFDAHQWRVPARVYARPVALSPGMAMQPHRLQQLLEKMGYQSRQGAPLPGSFFQQGTHWLIHSRGVELGKLKQLPHVLALTLEQGRITHMEDATGRALAQFNLEPLLIGSVHPGQQEERVLVELAQVPPLLIELLLATEDRHFYSHYGVSLRGLARALLANIQAGTVRQGGSTLTQQLVKNFWLTRERTYSRKLLEVLMALLLELHYSKEQILEAYLNEVYLGQDGGRAIHGVGLASHFFFGKPAGQLAPNQMALLVALLKGPSAYDPRRHPQRAQARRNQVLQAAQETGALSASQTAHWQAAPLEVIPRGDMTLYAFPAFLDLVRRQLRRDYASEDLANGGLLVISTLDLLAQLQAEQALSQFVTNQHRLKKQSLNGAVVITNPAQGDVLALVGDAEPRRAGFNRALDAIRPIGSLVKPAVLLTALQHPTHYSLATRIEDNPIEMTLENGETWSPDNFDHHSKGVLSLQQVLVQSRNQATARLGLDLGVEAVVETLRKLGVSRPISAYPSVLLGSVELSPLEVALMYQTLANQGQQLFLRSITDVYAANGTLLSRYPLQPKPVFEAHSIRLLREAMQGVMREGTGQSARQWLSDELVVAGKTGTSDGLRDAWFAGFSANHLAVVWVGRDDNQPVGLTGSSGALPIWAKAMAGLENQSLPDELPDQVQWVWVSGRGQLRQSAKGCAGAEQYLMHVSSIPVQRDACAAQQGLPGVGRKVKTWWQKMFGG